MISSVANPRVRRVRRLRKRMWRERQNRILVEGRRALVPAIEAGAVDEVFALPGMDGTPAVAAALARDIPVREVTPEVMAHMAAAARAPRVLALARPVIAVEQGPSALVLIDVRDPATAGALIEIAAATGMASAVVVRGSADPFAPSVVRAGGGGHFGTGVVLDPGPPEAAVKRARVAGATVLALAPEGPAPWEVELPGSLALAVTGDDTPVGDVDGTVAIPGAGALPPLAMRAAVVLYEWVRQRGERPG